MAFSPFLQQSIFTASVFGLVYIFGFIIRPKPKAYYFFISSYFILAFSLFMNYITFSGLIIQVPHLFRIGSLLQYLIGPISYFFVLLTLKPGTKLKAIHLLHLLPFIIHVAELMPFFMTGAAEKRIFLAQIGRNTDLLWDAPDGLFVSYRVQLLIKFSIIAIYLFFQWKLIYQYQHKWNPALKQQNRTLLQWIRFDTALKTLLTFFILVSTVLAHQNPVFTILPSIICIIDLILGIIYTLAFPSILMGIRPVNIDFENKAFPELIKGSNEEDFDFDLISSEAEADQGLSRKLFIQLETLMQTEQPFLDDNLSRDLLAKKLNIAARRLSETIKKETGLGFSDYINTYRIHYIEDMLHTDEKWKSYTIEAMAIQAGFYTRAAYNNSLKRLKDETPTDLLHRNS